MEISSPNKTQPPASSYLGHLQAVVIMYGEGEEWWAKATMLSITKILPSNTSYFTITTKLSFLGAALGCSQSGYPKIHEPTPV